MIQKDPLSLSDNAKLFLFNADIFALNHWFCTSFTDFFATLHLLNFVWNFDYNIQYSMINYCKKIEIRYIGIFIIINIGKRLPQIIGDLKEISAKLLISKITKKIIVNEKKYL